MYHSIFERPEGQLASNVWLVNPTDTVQEVILRKKQQWF